MTRMSQKVCADCAGPLYHWRIVFFRPRPPARWRRRLTEPKIVCVPCYAHCDANGVSRHDLNELAAIGTPVLGVDITTEEVSDENEG